MMALLDAVAMFGPLQVPDSGSIPGPILTLIDAAARALLVAGTVWAGLCLLRTRNVVAQKAAWGLVLAGAMLMPLFAPWAARLAWLPARATVVLPARLSPHTRAAKDSGASRQSLTLSDPVSGQGSGPVSNPVSHPQAAAASVVPANRPSSSEFDSLEVNRFPAPVISSSYSAGPGIGERARSAAMHPFLMFPTLAWLLYGAVCVAFLLRLLYGLAAAIALWQDAEPVSIESAPHLAAGLRVRSSRGVSSPVTVGSGIVLPADYHEWDAEKLRIVLAHERSHVRQGDFYLQTLAGLYAALFWFSPLGFWLKRKLSDLSEAISDRAGLDQAASSASYAQILLEFAALPRPTQIGVAMARTGRLTHRIERLLNENSFRQAFAGGRRRLLAALLLVPVALFAAAALIRVEAAGQAPQTPAPAKPPAAHPAPAPAEGQSHPEDSADAVDAAEPAAPDADEPTDPPTIAPVAPVTPVTPVAPFAPVAQVAPVANVAPIAPLAPVAPMPMILKGVDGSTVLVGGGRTLILARAQSDSDSASASSSGSGKTWSHSGTGHGYSYSYSSNGDSYALITANDKNHVRFSGEWFDGRKAELEKARSMAKGDFLWFTRDGKSYILDDPAVVANIQAMYKPMEELGKQQEELGRQQEALGREQEKLGQQQEQASIPAPDLSREMAELNEAVAKLQAKKGTTITEDQLSDLEGKIGDLQGKLGELQGEVGRKQGQFGDMQGKLGEQQGKLGEQQGRLGEQQGRIAQETDRKVKSIIDESMHDGKAKPVE